MADIVITDQAIRLTVSGSVNAGEVVADLTPAAIVNAAGALLAVNNLDDVDSAAAARTNLGATATGDALFVAATEAAAQLAIGATATGSALITAANAAAAATAVGATATGSSLLTAATAQVARAAIVANVLPLALHFADVRAATAMARWYPFAVISGFLAEVIVTLDAPLATGDMTLTIDSVTAGVSTPVTFASTAVPEAGSAAGYTIRFIPTGGNAISTLTSTRVTISGANTAAIGATIVVKAVY